MTLAEGQKVFGQPESRHYNGRYLWNLNPGFGVNGHFALPSGMPVKSALRARVDVLMVDIYEREHRLLPVGYVKTADQADWYLEPSEEALGIPRPRRKNNGVGR